MNIRREIIVTWFCCLLGGLSPVMSSAETVEAEPTVQASELRVPDAFTAVIGQTIGGETAPALGTDGSWHVVYELVLTNARPIPASIGAIQVLDYRDTSKALLTISRAEIVASGVNLSGRPRPRPETPEMEGQVAILQPNESMVIFIELAFDTLPDVPESIIHEFSGMAATNPGSRLPVPVSYLFAPKRLSTSPIPLIFAPLKGDDWVAINGCCDPGGAHRGAIQSISGSLYVAQRFAVDWIKIGDNGKFFAGDPSEVSNWHNYGQPVLAVADGTVVETVDELDDQSPGTLPDPSSLTIETVDGNHVILDIGNGVFVFYAHLKRGSVAVKKGDVVKAGDQIGELGNSGNTSAPHLHIHLMTSPSSLAADGYPYHYEDMRFTGQIDRQQWNTVSEVLDDVWIINAPGLGLPTKPIMPMDLDVVSFD